jgi:hypothetical protein
MPQRWIIAAALLCATASQASVVTYTNRSQWLTAAGGAAVTADFTAAVAADATAPFINSLPAAYHGFTFKPTATTMGYVTGPAYATVPPGVYDWNSGPVMVFSYGDRTLDIAFGGPVYSFGLDYGIFDYPAPGQLSFGGTLGLALPDGTAIAAAAETAQRLRFVGLVSTTPFSAVRLTTPNDTAVLDNISRGPGAHTVPEPGTLGVAGAALLVLSRIVKKRTSEES